ncbi:hypothetical protein [Streptomyces sp. IB2014 016-6]|uniref:hypothetical protein n=1 Tax=Streptomyces sp. IB2014 016-6 TaxID=2517818 RepID=UPI001650081D|nr:hypothetical protein [Streptomyces sp. IB2014 016-6]
MSSLTASAWRAASSAGARSWSIALAAGLGWEGVQRVDEVGDHCEVQHPGHRGRRGA